MLTDLLRWNPADELRSIFGQFERRLSTWSRFSDDRSLPQMSSSDDRMRLRIPLPGLSREDVEITSVGRTLRIRASRRDDDNHTLQYEQQLTLPEYVDTTRAGATMRNGLLEISLPYSEELKPKKIEIDVETPKQKQIAAA